LGRPEKDEGKTQVTEVDQVASARRVLGVGAAAGPEQIRSAYLEKVKAYPPERYPEEFEAIRDAFETLSDVRKRTMARLRGGDPRPYVLSVLDGEPASRLYAGPQAWLDVL
jgi:curved DNA-binding protein CbpA